MTFIIKLHAVCRGAEREQAEKLQSETDRVVKCLTQAETRCTGLLEALHVKEAR